MVVLPPPVVKRYRLDARRLVHVVREDLLPGGTKRRGLHALIVEPAEHVYASPTWGYGQVSLAEYCRAAGPGYRATLFVPERRKYSPMTEAARAAGGKI